MAITPFAFFSHPVWLSPPPFLFPPAFEVASMERLASLLSQRGECDDTRGNVTNQQRAVSTGTRQDNTAGPRLPAQECMTGQKTLQSLARGILTEYCTNTTNVWTCLEDTWCWDKNLFTESHYWDSAAPKIEHYILYWGVCTNIIEWIVVDAGRGPKRNSCAGSRIWRH